MSTSNHPHDGRGDQEKHGQMAEEIKKTGTTREKSLLPTLGFGVRFTNQKISPQEEGEQCGALPPVGRRRELISQ